MRVQDFTTKRADDVLDVLSRAWHTVGQSVKSVRQQEGEDVDVICLEERKASNKSCCRREHVQLSSATSGPARLFLQLSLKRWRGVGSDSADCSSLLYLVLYPPALIIVSSLDLISVFYRITCLSSLSMSR